MHAAVFCERNTAAWPAELPPPMTITFLADAELGLHEGGVVIDSLPVNCSRLGRDGLLYWAPMASTIVRAGITCPSSSVTL